MAAKLGTFELNIVGSSSPIHFTAFVPDDRGRRIAEHHFVWHPESAALAVELNTLAQAAASEAPSDEKLHYTFGQRLFTTVFAGAVGNLWHRRLAMLQDKQVMRLVIRVDDKTARPFLNLPWEYLHDGDHFLALNRSMPLSRLPWKLTGKSLPQLMEPLRLLVHIATPLDLKQNQVLNVAREEDLMLTALAEARQTGRIEVLFTPNGSLETLEAALLEFDPHILHFVGHGVFEENVGVLWMETLSGYTREVKHAEFADLIKQQAQSLRLVFLSACQLAIASEDEGYTDLAQYLLEIGIPAVVAMQYSVRDSSAISFSKSFYKSLSEGQMLDSALTEARNAFVYGEQVSAEFAVPVLFLADPTCLQVNQALLQHKNFLPHLDLAGITPTENFVGRSAELRILQISLDPEYGRWRAAIIYGLGGMGKTALAARLAERMSSRFDGAIAIQITPESTAQSVLDELDAFLLSNRAYLNNAQIQVFFQAKDEPEPVGDKINGLIAVLRTVRLLLIFDNYEAILPQWQVVSRDAPVTLPATSAEPSVQRPDNKDLDLQKLLALLIQEVAGPSRFLFISRVDFQPAETDFAGEAIGHLGLGELQFRDAVYLMETLPPLAPLPVAISTSTDHDHTPEPPVLSMRQLYEKFGGHPSSLVRFAAGARQSSPERLLADPTFVEKDLLDLTLLDRIVVQLPEHARIFLHRAAIYAEPVPVEGLSFLLDHEEDNVSVALEDIQILQPWGFLVQLPGTALYSFHTIVRNWVYQRMGTNERQNIFTRAADFWMKRWHESGELNALLYAFKYRISACDSQRAAEIALLICGIAAEYQIPFEIRLRFLMECLQISPPGERRALRFALAATYIGRGDHMAAAQQLQASIEEGGTKREDGSIQGTITTGELYNLMQLQGQLARGQGEYKLAKYQFEAALGLAKSENDQLGIALALLDLAVVHRFQGEYKQALEYSEQALSHFLTIGAHAAIVRVQREIAHLQTRLGDRSKARKSWEKLLELAQDLGDSLEIANVLMEIGQQYWLERRITEARRVFEQALEHFRSIGDKEGESSALHYLGMVHQAHGEFEPALKCYNEALAIAEAMGDQHGMASTLSQIGILHGFHGKFEQEQDFQERALTIRRQISDKQGIAICLHQLGLIRTLKGEHEQARSYFEEAVTIKRELGDQVGLGKSLHMLSQVYEHLEDHEQARACAEQALEHFELGGYPAGIAGALCELSSLVEKEGEYEKAVQYAAQAYVILSELHLGEQIVARKLLSHLRDQRDEKEFEAALKQTPWYQKVSKIFHSELTGIIQTWISLSISDSLEARRFLEAHPELLEPNFESAIGNYLASSEDDSEESISHNHMRSLRYLLREARRRGGELEAIREAYIDAKGSFSTLEQPPWLEEVQRQLRELEREPSMEAFEKRVILLQQALEYARNDSAVAPETFADLLNWLAREYQYAPRGNHPLMVEEAISLNKRASQIYTLQRYPRQFAMIQGNLGNLYAVQFGKSKRENLVRSIAHYKAALTLFNRDYFPEEWTLTQKKLSNIYRQNQADAQNLRDAADGVLAEILAAEVAENSFDGNQQALKHPQEIPEVTFASATLRLQEAYRSFVAQAQPSCSLLRAMKLLFLMRTKIMTEQRVRHLALEVLGETSFQETNNWKATLADLEREEFLSYKDEVISIKKESYFDSVIDDYPGDALFAECERSVPVFARQRDGEALLNLAQMLTAHGRFEETIHTCSALIEVDPLSARAYFLLGTSASELGRFDDAIKALNTSLEIDSTQVDGWMNKGHLLNETGKYEQALDAFDHALALSAPPAAYGNTWYNKGRTFMKMHRNAEAIEAFERALSFPLPQEPTFTVYALNNMGNVFSDDMRLEEAILCYNEALQLAPRYTPLWINKARALYYLDRYREAFEVAHQACVLEPNNRLGQEIRGMAAWDVERMEKMLDENSEALRQNPDDMQGWYRQGIALTNLGEHEQALNICGLALQRQPENAEIWRLKGSIMLVLENYEQALATFDQALALDPQVRFAEQGKKRVARIQAFLKRREGREAEKGRRSSPVSPTTGERPNDHIERASSLIQLAQLAHQHSHYLAALRYLVQALALQEHPSSADRDLALHRIAEIQSELDESLFADLWKQAADGQPLPDLPTVEHRSDLLQHLTSFVQAQTWTESESFLEAHPELLASEAEALMEILAAAQQDESMRKMIEMHRAILIRAREVGIATAFEEFQTYLKALADNAVREQLNVLCGQVVDALRTNDAAKRGALATHLERIIADNPSLKGFHDFLALLAAWLRGENVTGRLESLHPEFQESYKRMIILVSQTEQ